MDIEAYIQSVITGTDYKIALGRIRHNHQKYTVKEDGPYSAANISYVSDDYATINGKYKNNNTNNHMTTEAEFAPPPRTPGYASTAPEDSWSKRKIKVRNIILIVLGCALFIGLAVGTAVGIILHTNASLASTLSPTTPSTTVSDHIMYTGVLKLSQPWPDSESSLNSIVTREINEIMMNSSFQEYYISSKVQKYSPQDNSIVFILEFLSSLRGLNLTSDPDTDEYANKIEIIIRSGTITLPVIVSSIIIIDQITPTTTQRPMSTKETTTENVSSYTENVTSTTEIVTSTTENMTSTTENATLTTENVTSTTEMVTSTTENVTPTTENATLTTENVTSTTENVTSTTEMTTTTEKPTTTTEYVISTTPDPRRCVYQDFELCREFGNTFTLLPNYFGDESISSAANTFFTYFNHTVNSGCSKDVLYYFCNLVFPQCDEVNGSAVAIYPCVSTCDEVTIPCDMEMPFPLDCSFFESDPSKCVTPPKEITTPAPKTCQSIEINFDYCGDLGFNVTSFPSLFGSNIGEVRTAFTSYALSTVQTQCHPDVQFFYCGLFFPKCENGEKILPCKSICEEVNAACGDSSRFPVDCEIFTNDTQRCLSVNDTTVIPGPSTTPSPSTTTVPVGDRCIPNGAEVCRSFGIFNESFFPNQWGLNSEYQAVDNYKVGEPTVVNGCSNGTLFWLCLMLFPPCDSQFDFQRPCLDFCEEWGKECQGVFPFDQPCDQLADNRPNCLRPPPPKVCSSDEFSCHGSQECIPSNNVCDGYGDCTDWSDERNCDCNEYQYQCKMGMCIKNYQRCDTKYDCPDLSDEENCTTDCPQGQYKCKSGICIMPEWVCDGLQDCGTTFDDEENCPECMPGEFRCLSGECIQASQRCDGAPQCSDHSDEKSCIIEVDVFYPFLVRHGDDWSPVCATNFTNEKADLVCRKLGNLMAIEWATEDYFYDTFIHMDPQGNNTSIIGRSYVRKYCENNAAVKVRCEERQCGKRSTQLKNFIVNGNDAPPCSWPWQVSLQRVGKHYCGGSLISPNFVVTAAHCIESYQYNFDFIDIVLGATKLSVKESMQTTRKIKRLVLHNHIFHEKNDIAIIQLDRSVNYTQCIRPICLPEQNEVFSRGDLCYAVGWGMKAWDTTFSNRLQEAKMTLWDTQKCNSSIAWNGAVGDTFICAGYYSGFISTCSGDSGGSLVCQANDMHWKLVGISSYVAKGCNVPERPVVFSDAKFFTPWIQNHTECIFTCDNGICIYDKQQLCNRENDCGDNSDELRPCSVSVSCTFDDPFLCGYGIVWERLSATDYFNHYALYDHTVGSYPGYFMVARKRGLLMKTPRFNATSNQCLRFFYHMRGEIRGGIQVWFNKYMPDGSSTWEPIFKRKDETLPDKWFTGNIQMKDGQFEVVFVSNHDGRIVMDDVQLLDSPCVSAACSTDQFQCGSGAEKQCIHKDSKCNMVIDCESGEDEEGCTDPSFFCDFENPHLCGFDQSTTDNEIAEWKVVNSSKTPDRFQDHSAKPLGNMLIIETRNLLESKEVVMTQHLRLRGTAHCLSFYYFSDTTGSFKIHYEQPNETKKVVLWEIKDRFTSIWSKTQLQLPAEQDLLLTYTMYGGTFDGTFRPFIALDDMKITEGQCPTFVCKDGYQSCPNENFCLPLNKFCNRKMDCAGGSDEAECQCTDKEYKCPGGPCISIDRTCNRIQDCLDGADEGEMCDPLRTVPCDFEHPFLCGYKMQDGDYRWKRNAGGTNTAGTGPNNDHTFKNSSGHYLYADGSDGRHFDKTVLETTSFNSTGKSLEFFYHIYSMFADFAKETGTLVLTVKDRDLGQSYDMLVEIATTRKAWRKICLELPPSSSISLLFVAQRGNQTQADVAIDDVRLIHGSCQRVEGTTAGTEEATTARTPASVTSSPELSKCDNGKRPCRSGLCIPNTQWCDGVSDCLDKSDEITCPSS